MSDAVELGERGVVVDPAKDSRKEGGEVVEGGKRRSSGLKIHSRRTTVSEAPPHTPEVCVGELRRT